MLAAVRAVMHALNFLIRRRMLHLGAVKAADGNELIANLVAVLLENPIKI